MLEWWDKYRRILLPAAAVLLIASSIWLYQARGTGREGTTGQLPLIPPAYASEEGVLATEDGHLTSDKTTASAADAGNRSARIAAGASQPTAPGPAFGAADATNAAHAPQAKNAQPADPPASPLYVDVKGSVRQPGLYRLEVGMRVADAIAKAGGAKPEADLDQLNLAAPLVDGTAIVIPAKGSAPPSLAVAASPVSPAGVSSYDVSAASLGGASASQARSSSSFPEQPVLLNTATLEQLMTLPGIGEARARAILQYREEKGGFRSPEELQNIEGIGEKLYARIKERIRVR
ncbi:helix-hairpin-helix domain-containing protein [Brevibacillus sp. GCM10020057]